MMFPLFSIPQGHLTYDRNTKFYTLEDKEELGNLEEGKPYYMYYGKMSFSNTDKSVITMGNVGLLGKDKCF